MKGALSSTMLIILAVIVLAFGLSMVQGSFNLADAFDITGVKERKAAIERGDDLEAATKCAYYRCFGDDKGGKGCDSDMAKGISWNDDKRKCSEFCKKETLQAIGVTDGRVCNEKAKSYPVEFLPIGKATIQADDLKDEFGCLTATDSCSLGFFGKLISLKGDKILYIDANEIEPKTVRTIGTEACAGHLNPLKEQAPIAGATAVTVGGILLAIVPGAQRAGVAVVVAGAPTAYITLDKILEDKSIKSTTVKSGLLYIWAQDDSKLESIFYDFIPINFKGTTDHVYLCGNEPPQCTGKADLCEKRLANQCKKELGCEWDKGLAKEIELAKKRGEKICKGTETENCRRINACKPIEIKNATGAPIYEKKPDGSEKKYEGPKRCEHFFDKGSCLSQSGCSWSDKSECGKDSDCPTGQVCGADKFCRLPVINDENELATALKSPLDGNVKGLFEAIKATEGLSGRLDRTLDYWGTGTLSNLFANPSVADLNFWKEFKRCEGGELHSACLSENKYCYKGTKTYYPEKCGCPKGKGTKPNEGKRGKQCEEFDKTPEDVSDIVIDKDNSYLSTDVATSVKADGKDTQMILATLLDSNGVVVTGINPTQVNFATTLGDLARSANGNPDIFCLTSGAVNERYFSCGIKITSKQAGTATINFIYPSKNIEKKIQVQFVKS